MATPKVMSGKGARCELPQYWRDKIGSIRLMGVVEGYALMRRPGKVPFVIAGKDLISGRAGIERDNKGSD